MSGDQSLNPFLISRGLIRLFSAGCAKDATGTSMEASFVAPSCSMVDSAAASGVLGQWLYERGIYGIGRYVTVTLLPFILKVHLLVLLHSLREVTSHLT